MTRAIETSEIPRKITHCILKEEKSEKSPTKYPRELVRKTGNIRNVEIFMNTMMIWTSIKLNEQKRSIFFTKRFKMCDFQDILIFDTEPELIHISNNKLCIFD